MTQRSHGNNKIDELMGAMDELRRLDDETVAKVIESMEVSVRELRRQNSVLVQGKAKAKQ